MTMKVFFKGAGWGTETGENGEGRDTVDYHAGGGIVWDSNAEAEWRETEAKAREFGASTATLDAGGRAP